MLSRLLATSCPDDDSNSSMSEECAIVLVPRVSPSTPDEDMVPVKEDLTSKFWQDLQRRSEEEKQLGKPSSRAAREKLLEEAIQRMLRHAIEAHRHTSVERAERNLDLHLAGEVATVGGFLELA